jgi:hypothetical protein
LKQATREIASRPNCAAEHIVIGAKAGIIAMPSGAKQARDSATPPRQHGAYEEDDNFLPSRLSKGEAKFDKNAYDGQWQSHGFRASQDGWVSKPILPRTLKPWPALDIRGSD